MRKASQQKRCVLQIWRKSGYHFTYALLSLFVLILPSEETLARADGPDAKDICPLHVDGARWLAELERSGAATDYNMSEGFFETPPALIDPSCLNAARRAIELGKRNCEGAIAFYRKAKNLMDAHVGQLKGTQEQVLEAANEERRRREREILQHRAAGLKLANELANTARAYGDIRSSVGRIQSAISQGRDLVCQKTFANNAQDKGKTKEFYQRILAMNQEIDRDIKIGPCASQNKNCIRKTIWEGQRLISTAISTSKAMEFRIKDARQIIHDYKSELKSLGDKDFRRDPQEKASWEASKLDAIDKAKEILKEDDLARRGPDAKGFLSAQEREDLEKIVASEKELTYKETKRELKSVIDGTDEETKKKAREQGEKEAEHTKNARKLVESWGLEGVKSEERAAHILDEKISEQERVKKKIEFYEKNGESLNKFATLSALELNKLSDRCMRAIGDGANPDDCVDGLKAALQDIPPEKMKKRILDYYRERQAQVAKDLQSYATDREKLLAIANKPRSVLESESKDLAKYIESVESLGIKSSVDMRIPDSELADVFTEKNQKDMSTSATKKLEEIERTKKLEEEAEKIEKARPDLAYAKVIASSIKSVNKDSEEEIAAVYKECLPKDSEECGKRVLDAIAHRGKAEIQAFKTEIDEDKDSKSTLNYFVKGHERVRTCLTKPGNTLTGAWRDSFEESVKKLDEACGFTKFQEECFKSAVCRATVVDGDPFHLLKEKALHRYVKIDPDSMRGSYVAGRIELPEVSEYSNEKVAQFKEKVEDQYKTRMRSYQNVIDPPKTQMDCTGGVGCIEVPTSPTTACESMADICQMDPRKCALALRATNYTGVALCGFNKAQSRAATKETIDDALMYGGFALMAVPVIGPKMGIGVVSAVTAARIASVGARIGLGTETLAGTATAARVGMGIDTFTTATTVARIQAFETATIRASSWGSLAFGAWDFASLPMNIKEYEDTKTNCLIGPQSKDWCKKVNDAHTQLIFSYGAAVASAGFAKWDIQGLFHKPNHLEKTLLTQVGDVDDTTKTGTKLETPGPGTTRQEEAAQDDALTRRIQTELEKQRADAEIAQRRAAEEAARKAEAEAAAKAEAARLEEKRLAEVAARTRAEAEALQAKKMAEADAKEQEWIRSRQQQAQAEAEAAAAAKARAEAEAAKATEARRQAEAARVEQERLAAVEAAKRAEMEAAETARAEVARKAKAAQLEQQRLAAEAEAAARARAAAWAKAQAEEAKAKQMAAAEDLERKWIESRQAHAEADAAAAKLRKQEEAARAEEQRLAAEAAAAKGRADTAKAEQERLAAEAEKISALARADRENTERIAQEQAAESARKAEAERVAQAAKKAEPPKPANDTAPQKGFFTSLRERLFGESTPPPSKPADEVARSPARSEAAARRAEEAQAAAKAGDGTTFLPRPANTDKPTVPQSEGQVKIAVGQNRDLPGTRQEDAVIGDGLARFNTPHGPPDVRMQIPITPPRTPDSGPKPGDFTTTSPPRTEPNGGAVTPPPIITGPAPPQQLTRDVTNQPNTVVARPSPSRPPANPDVVRQAQGRVESASREHQNAFQTRNRANRDVNIAIAKRDEAVRRGDANAADAKAELAQALERQRAAEANYQNARRAYTDAEREYAFVRDSQNSPALNIDGTAAQNVLVKQAEQKFLAKDLDEANKQLKRAQQDLEMAKKSGNAETVRQANVKWQEKTKQQIAAADEYAKVERELAHWKVQASKAEAEVAGKIDAALAGRNDARGNFQKFEDRVREIQVQRGEVAVAAKADVEEIRATNAHTDARGGSSLVAGQEIRRLNPGETGSFKNVDAWEAGHQDTLRAAMDLEKAGMKWNGVAIRELKPKDYEKFYQELYIQRGHAKLLDAFMGSNPGLRKLPDEVAEFFAKRAEDYFVEVARAKGLDADAIAKIRESAKENPAKIVADWHHNSNIKPTVVDHHGPFATTRNTAQQVLDDFSAKIREIDSRYANRTGAIADGQKRQEIQALIARTRKNFRFVSTDNLGDYLLAKKILQHLEKMLDPQHRKFFDTVADYVDFKNFGPDVYIRYWLARDPGNAIFKNADPAVLKQYTKFSDEELKAIDFAFADASLATHNLKRTATLLDAQANRLRGIRNFENLQPQLRNVADEFQTEIPKKIADARAQVAKEKPDLKGAELKAAQDQKSREILAGYANTLNSWAGKLRAGDRFQFLPPSVQTRLENRAAASQGKLFDEYFRAAAAPGKVPFRTQTTRAFFARLDALQEPLASHGVVRLSDAKKAEIRARHPHANIEAAEREMVFIDQTAFRAEAKAKTGVDVGAFEGYLAPQAYIARQRLAGNTDLRINVSVTPVVEKGETLSTFVIAFTNGYRGNSRFNDMAKHFQAANINHMTRTAADAKPHELKGGPEGAPKDLIFHFFPGVKKGADEIAALALEARAIDPELVNLVRANPPRAPAAEIPAKLPVTATAPPTSDTRGFLSNTAQSFRESQLGRWLGLSRAEISLADVKKWMKPVEEVGGDTTKVVGYYKAADGRDFQVVQKKTGAKTWNDGFRGDPTRIARVYGKPTADFFGYIRLSEDMHLVPTAATLNRQFGKLEKTGLWKNSFQFAEPRAGDEAVRWRDYLDQYRRGIHPVAGVKPAKVKRPDIKEAPHDANRHFEVGTNPENLDQLQRFRAGMVVDFYDWMLKRTPKAQRAAMEESLADFMRFHSDDVDDFAAHPNLWGDRPDAASNIRRFGASPESLVRRELRPEHKPLFEEFLKQYKPEPDLRNLQVKMEFPEWHRIVQERRLRLRDAVETFTGARKADLVRANPTRAPPSSLSLRDRMLNAWTATRASFNESAIGRWLGRSSPPMPTRASPPVRESQEDILARINGPRKDDKDLLNGYEGQNLIKSGEVQGVIDRANAEARSLHAAQVTPDNPNGLRGKKKTAATEQEANDLFAYLNNNAVAGPCPVKTSYPKAGMCYGRAFTTYMKALDMGLCKDCVYKVWKVASRSNPGNLLRKADDPMESWTYHVAFAIPVRDVSGKVSIKVIDTSLADGPISVERWNALVNKTSIHVDHPQGIPAGLEYPIYFTSADRIGVQGPGPATKAYMRQNGGTEFVAKNRWTAYNNATGDYFKDGAAIVRAEPKVRARIGQLIEQFPDQRKYYEDLMSRMTSEDYARFELAYRHGDPVGADSLGRGTYTNEVFDEKGILLASDRLSPADVKKIMEDGLVSKPSPSVRTPSATTTVSTTGIPAQPTYTVGRVLERMTPLENAGENYHRLVGRFTDEETGLTYNVHKQIEKPKDGKPPRWQDGFTGDLEWPTRFYGQETAERLGYIKLKDEKLGEIYLSPTAETLNRTLDEAAAAGHDITTARFIQPNRARATDAEFNANAAKGQYPIASPETVPHPSKAGEVELKGSNEVAHDGVYHAPKTLLLPNPQRQQMELRSYVYDRLEAWALKNEKTYPGLWGTVLKARRDHVEDMDLFTVSAQYHREPPSPARAHEHDPKMNEFTEAPVTAIKKKLDADEQKYFDRFLEESGLKGDSRFFADKHLTRQEWYDGFQRQRDQLVRAFTTPPIPRETPVEITRHTEALSTGKRTARNNYGLPRPDEARIDEYLQRRVNHKLNTNFRLGKKIHGAVADGELRIPRALFKDKVSNLSWVILQHEAHHAKNVHKMSLTGTNDWFNAASAVRLKNKWAGPTFEEVSAYYASGLKAEQLARQYTKNIGNPNHLVPKETKDFAIQSYQKGWEHLQAFRAHVSDVKPMLAKGEFKYNPQTGSVVFEARTNALHLTIAKNLSPDASAAAVRNAIATIEKRFDHFEKMYTSRITRLTGKPPVDTTPPVVSKPVSPPPKTDNASTTPTKPVPEKPPEVTRNMEALSRPTSRFYNFFESFKYSSLGQSRIGNAILRRIAKTGAFDSIAVVEKIPAIAPTKFGRKGPDGITYSQSAQQAASRTIADIPRVEWGNLTNMQRIATARDPRYPGFNYHELWRGELNGQKVIVKVSRRTKDLTDESPHLLDDLVHEASWTMWAKDKAPVSATVHHTLSPQGNHALVFQDFSDSTRFPFGPQGPPAGFRPNAEQAAEAKRVATKLFDAAEEQGVYIGDFQLLLTKDGKAHPIDFAEYRLAASREEMAKARAKAEAELQKLEEMATGSAPRAPPETSAGARPHAEQVAIEAAQKQAKLEYLDYIVWSSERPIHSEAAKRTAARAFADTKEVPWNKITGLRKVSATAGVDGNNFQELWRGKLDGRDVFVKVLKIKKSLSDSDPRYLNLIAGELNWSQWVHSKGHGSAIANRTLSPDGYHALVFEDFPGTHFPFGPKGPPSDFRPTMEHVTEARRVVKEMFDAAEREGVHLYDFQFIFGRDGKVHVIDTGLYRLAEFNGEIRRLRERVETELIALEAMARRIDVNSLDQRVVKLTDNYLKNLADADAGAARPRQTFSDFLHEFDSQWGLRSPADRLASLRQIQDVAMARMSHPYYRDFIDDFAAEKLRLEYPAKPDPGPARSAKTQAREGAGSAPSARDLQDTVAQIQRIEIDELAKLHRTTAARPVSLPRSAPREYQVLARKTFGANYPDAKIDALWRSHIDYPCAIGNCTAAELHGKLKILRKAKVDWPEIRKAIEHGFSGQPSANPLKRKPLPVEPKVEWAGEQFLANPQIGPGKREFTAKDVEDAIEAYAPKWGSSHNRDRILREFEDALVLHRSHPNLYSALRATQEARRNFSPIYTTGDAPSRYFFDAAYRESVEKLPPDIIKNSTGPKNQKTALMVVTDARFRVDFENGGKELPGKVYATTGEKSTIDAMDFQPGRSGVGHPREPAMVIALHRDESPYGGFLHYSYDFYKREYAIEMIVAGHDITGRPIARSGSRMIAGLLHHLGPRATIKSMLDFENSKMLSNYIAHNRQDPDLSAKLGRMLEGYVPEFRGRDLTLTRDYSSDKYILIIGPAADPPKRDFGGVLPPPPPASLRQPASMSVRHTDANAGAVAPPSIPSLFEYNSNRRR